MLARVHCVCIKYDCIHICIYMCVRNLERNIALIETNSRINICLIYTVHLQLNAFRHIDLRCRENMARIAKLNTKASQASYEQSLP